MENFSVLSSLKFNKTHLALFLLCFLILLGIDFFTRDILSEYSLAFQFQVTPSLPADYVTLFRKISELATYRWISLYFLALLNFSNIYKTLFLVFNIEVSNLVASLLKTAYKQARPFWLYPELFSGDCDGSWGTPSGHSIEATTCFLTLLIIFSSPREKHNSTVIDYLYALVFGLLIGIVTFSRIILGSHSASQILLGVGCGTLIVAFSNTVFSVELDNPSQLVNIARKKVTGVLSLFVLLSSLPWILSSIVGNENEFDSSLTRLCPDLAEGNKYNENSILNSAGFAALFFLFLGLKLQFSWLCKEDEVSFICLNFDQSEEHKRSLMKISEDNSTQWNHTSPWKLAARLLISGAVLYLLSIPYYGVSSKLPFITVFVCQRLIPYSIGFFCLSFLLPWLFLKIGLTNENSANLFAGESLNSW